MAVHKKCTSDIMIVFLSIGIVLSITLNFIVIMVVLSKRHHIRNIDLFQLSLAMSDIIRASIGYPLELYAAISSREISETSCKIAGFSTTFLGLVAMNHLAGISIERSIMMNFPWRAREWLVNRAMSLYIILPSWLYGLLWAGMPLLGWSAYYPEEGTKYRCSIDLSSKTLNARSFAYSLLTCCFFVPVIAIAISSVFTLRKLKNMTNGSRILGARGESTLRRKRELKHSIMVFVLIATFLISWTPYAICVFLLTSTGRVNTRALNHSALFAKSSTIYNPIIYFIFLKEFRYGCLSLFRCEKPLPMDKSDDFVVRRGSSIRKKRVTDVTIVSITEMVFFPRHLFADQKETDV